MVDLAKIRKKAKGTGRRAQGAGEPPQGAGGRAQGADQGTGRRAQGAGEPVPPADAAQTTDNRQPTTPQASDNRQPTTPQAQGNQQPATSNKLERFKEQAGKRRETVKAAAVEQTHGFELLTFLIAGEQYAVDIERIVEIVPPRPVTRIPNADPSVVGIISLRGTIVTLVDVRRKLGHPPGSGNAGSRVVVIDFRHETIGFAVDRVLRVVKLAAAEVEPHPVVHATELEASIRGVFRTSGALTILLDLDKLLDSHSTRLNNGPDLQTVRL